MSETSFLSPDHDHGHCLEVAIARARSLCERSGIKFTTLRERVFRAIASSHTAIGAYDIIELLAKDGKRIAPISMYRILDTLSEMGLIHRLESRNSYFACHQTHKSDENSDKRLVFLICNKCKTVVEVEAPDIGNAMKNISETSGFQMCESLHEITGICRHCIDMQSSMANNHNDENEKSTYK